jgi:putative transposase
MPKRCPSPSSRRSAVFIEVQEWWGLDSNQHPPLYRVDENPPRTWCERAARSLFDIQYLFLSPRQLASPLYTLSSHKGVCVPRRARIVVPNCFHHIVQRGHNCSALFVESHDYEKYLADLEELKQVLNCEIAGYCLMTNHVHLLINPGNETSNLSRLMKILAARYSRYINKLESKRSTVWDGRFFSSPIQNDHYLLACSRYIDLNPVRAQMVGLPEEYPWSSYKAKIGLENCSWLDFKISWRSYQDWCRESVDAAELDFIRSAVNRNQLTGDKRFINEIEERTGRRIAHRNPGRPSKTD